MTKLILNEQFSLNTKDGRKALIILIGTVVLTYVQSLIPGWNIPEEAKAAIAAVLTYVAQRFLATPSVTTTYDSNAKAESVAAKIEKENPKPIS